jgi:hypothetical protein
MSFTSEVTQGYEDLRHFLSLFPSTRVLSLKYTANLETLILNMSGKAARQHGVSLDRVFLPNLHELDLSLHLDLDDDDEFNGKYLLQMLRVRGRLLAQTVSASGPGSMNAPPVPLTHPFKLRLNIAFPGDCEPEFDSGQIAKFSDDALSITSRYIGLSTEVSLSPFFESDDEDDTSQSLSTFFESDDDEDDQ